MFHILLAIILKSGNMSKKEVTRPRKPPKNRFALQSLRSITEGKHPESSVTPARIPEGRELKEPDQDAILPSPHQGLSSSTQSTSYDEQSEHVLKGYGKEFQML